MTDRLKAFNNVLEGLTWNHHGHPRSRNCCMFDFTWHNWDLAFVLHAYTVLSHPLEFNGVKNEGGLSSDV